MLILIVCQPLLKSCIIFG